MRGKLLVAVLIAMLAAATGASAAPPRDYVALGDSYAAGPLIPLQVPLFGCLKSNNNYANLTARNLGLNLTDASCSGAETEDMENPQNVDPDGPNPPQFDSLSKKTRIVTIQIGGNDIGFSSIARDCSSTSPEGTPCQDRFVHDGRDEISERIQATAPLVAAVLQGIHARSPKARVLLVNYAAILPDTGPGCWPQVPITEGDVPYVRAKEKELNAMLAAQAAANSAEVVDWYTASIGRDACQPPVIRWVEPAVPVNAAAPLHPNLGGMLGASGLLGAALSR
ncbi:MAG TPA: SGNH/GDSL hydrolase family protein [Thermoleophilaceae bacterium]|jgi:lysophospholipase L1-like esterase|nr:SGNH/GDSL hydrolase family protein [Thermoleophilaceae bacterium]